MGSELRLYDVTVGAHKTRMRLDERDAAAMGDDAVLVGQEHVTPHQVAPVETKSRLVTSNKMRGTDDKNRGPHEVV